MTKLKTMFCIAMTLIGALATTSLHAEWDWDNSPDDQTFDKMMTLDVNDDLDRTELDILKNGNEVDFFIREYRNGILVDADHFDRWIGNGLILLIEGGNSIDDIYVDPTLADDDVLVAVIANDGDDMVEGAYYAQGNDGKDTLKNGFVMYGGDHDDRIYAGSNTVGMFGDDGDDYMNGTAATDDLIMDGGDEDDYMIGSPYSDTMIGGDGDDDMFGNGGSDEMYGDTTNMNDTGNDLMIGGDGWDKMYGGPGNDFMFGGDRKDYVYGETGIDFIIGGGGDDVMNPGPWEGFTESVYGSSGKDLFIAPTWPGYYYHDYSYQAGDDWFVIRMR